MKKLLALLLALMLPCCALAETATLTVSVESHTEGLRWLRDTLLSAASQSEREELAALFSDDHLAAIQRFLNGWRTRFTTDGESAFSLAYDLMGEELLTLLCRLPEDTSHQVQVLSNLFPGLMLTETVSMADTSPVEETLEKLAALDWDDVLLQALNIMDDWFDTLEMQSERQAFSGDAYEDGASCDTYRFDDRDVSVLIDALLRKVWPCELDDAWETICAFYQLPSARLSETLRTQAMDTAFENRYAYVLRLVYDEDDFPLGLSLTSYEEQTQVATLSVGFQDDGLKAVLGYGIKGENIYLDLSFAETISGESLRVRMLRDAGRAGYAMTDRDPDSVLLSADLVAGDENDEPTVRLTLGGALLNGFEPGLLFTGGEDSLSTTVSINGTKLLTVNTALSFGEPMPAFDDGKPQIIDLALLSQADMELLSQAMQQAAIKLCVQIFQLMPADLLTMFLTFSME